MQNLFDKCQIFNFQQTKNFSKTSYHANIDFMRFHPLANSKNNHVALLFFSFLHSTWVYGNSYRTLQFSTTLVHLTHPLTSGYDSQCLAIYVVRLTYYASTNPVQFQPPSRVLRSDRNKRKSCWNEEKNVYDLIWKKIYIYHVGTFTNVWDKFKIEEYAAFWLSTERKWNKYCMN